jgi:hypothetical protein
VSGHTSERPASPAALGVRLVHSKYLRNSTMKDPHEPRIGVLVAHETDQSYVECPSPSSDPSSIVHAQLASKHVSGPHGQTRPRGQRVACGIPSAETSPGDRCAQSAVIDQEVPGQEIPMEPD